MRRMIRKVKTVETMGTLFEALCELEGTSEGIRLLDYQAHRFLGLIRVVERVLDKWNPLEQWYAARARCPGRGPPSPFPLAGKYDVLVQLLSLLRSITVLDKMSQAELPTKVQTLLTLYRLRMATLNKREPLRDCRSARSNEKFFAATELPPLIAKTRQMLADALDDRFFKQYTDPKARLSASYIFEMQLFFQPQFKKRDLTLAKIVRFCNMQCGGATPDSCNRVVELIKRKVIEKVRKMMISIADWRPPVDSISTDLAPPTASPFSEDLVSYFGGDVETAPPVDIIEGRVEEEIQRWLAEHLVAVDPALKLWKQQAEDHGYKFLPQVAKIEYGIPISSAQIERDFGQSERMVTTHQTSLSCHTVDMCSFLNANSEFVDLAQCDKIASAELGMNFPSHVVVGVLDEMDNDMKAHLSTEFSSASIEH